MIIDVNIKNPTENDVIVWDGKKWINRQKSYFLNDLQQQVIKLQEELKNAKIELKKAQKTIIELASIMKGD